MTDELPTVPAYWTTSDEVAIRPTPARLTFHLPAKPIPWARPIPGRRKRSYNTKSYSTHRRALAWSAKAAARQAAWKGSKRPVKVICSFVHPRPKKRPYSVARAVWETGDAIPRPAVPDLDNLVKCVLEALEDAGVVENDACVCCIYAHKWWAGSGVEVGTWVTVLEMDDE